MKTGGGQRYWYDQRGETSSQTSIIAENGGMLGVVSQNGTEMELSE